MVFKFLATFIIFTGLTGQVMAKDKQYKQMRYPAAEKYSVHKCEGIVKNKGIELLKNFIEIDDVSQISLDDKIKALPRIKSPNNKMKYDVLETTGYGYKGEYRLRFIFAKVNNGCILMGEEILDLSEL
jgi:hypothetical protein